MTDAIATDVREIPFETADGRTATLNEYAGRTTLVVNVASRCGLTPQYAQLEELQRAYADRGFTVIGFPSNQFLQELSDSEKIAEYCSATWGVTFPMTEKVKVNGRSAHPLYKELTRTPDAEGKTGRISWNFEKFVVAPDGRVTRFSPRTQPDAPEVIAAIEDALPR